MEKLFYIVKHERKDFESIWKHFCEFQYVLGLFCLMVTWVTMHPVSVYGIISKSEPTPNKICMFAFNMDKR